MNKKEIFLAILGILLLNISSMAFAQDAETREQEVMSDMIAQEAGVKVVSFEKRNIVDNIYEYTWTLKAEKGLFNVIGVHRVVKEKKPWQPIRTKDAVMMVPGDVSNFRTAFLAGKEVEAMPDNQSPAVYLAEENIDVWGIDLRWTFVPAGLCKITGCKFMKDWNTTTHIGDIRTAMKFAGLIRKMAGSSEMPFERVSVDDHSGITSDSRDSRQKKFGTMYLLGISRGAQFVYAYADMETTLPKGKRTVKGLIPIDMVYKYDPQATVFYCLDYSNQSSCGEVNAREAASVRYQALKSVYDSGTYYSEEGYNMKGIGALARIFPNEESPIIPGLTNWQAAMTVLSATYVTFQPPTAPYTSFYHYNAGVFDENDTVVGLQFSNPDYLVDLTQKVPAYQSLGEIIDGEAILAGEDTPYDDHLANITVPVCYFGAGGGMGNEALYVLSLLGSKDITTKIISTSPERPLDFGHADLLWAANAKDSVWKPIASCIKDY